MIIPPSNISLEVASSSSTVAQSDSIIQSFLNGANFVDFSPTPAVLTNNAPGVFSVGVNTVTFTLTASSGKTSTATATVTLNEAGAPVVTVPSNISVVAPSGAGIASTVSTIASFLEGASYTAFESPGKTIVTDAPINFPIGTTPVVFSVTDNRGKTGSAVANVTVTKAANPVVSAPSDITVKTQESSGGVARGDSTIAAFLAGATASASPSTPYTSPTATITNDAPSTFARGETIVTFTVTDDGGQTASATAKGMVDWSITIPNPVTGSLGTTVAASYSVNNLTFIRPPLGSEAPSATYGNGSSQDLDRIGTQYWRKMTHVDATSWCESRNGRLPTAGEVDRYILRAGAILGSGSNLYWETKLNWPQTHGPGKVYHYWTSSPPAGSTESNAKRRIMLTYYTGGGAAHVLQGQLMTNKHGPLCVGDD